MPTWPDAGPDPCIAGISSDTSEASPEQERFLLRAFRTFSEAAVSLERSYGELRIEVERLRRELEESHAGLERSLEENRSIREHLDRILEALPCGVLVVGSNGEISRLNPAAARLLKAQHRLGRGDNPKDIADLSSAVRSLLANAREGEAEREILPAEMPGTSQWLSARRAVVSDGERACTVYILEDLTERKRLEQAQQKLRREQALAEMSAVLAHEIRNPLGSMELFAGLLAESALDVDGRKWVEHVQAGLRTLAATVNNVLHFHSLPPPERSRLDLGEFLDWADGFVKPLARQARIEINLQNHMRGVVVAADRHRLEQVVLNLVLNAIRAMPGGGWIQIAGRLATENRAVLTIADTGPGILPEHLPNIFDPGFSTRTSSPGLGLAVCRKIVEQHGGTIAATSCPGAGATFTVSLPIDAAETGRSQE